MEYQSIYIATVAAPIETSDAASCVIVMSVYNAKQKHTLGIKSVRPIRSSIANRQVQPKALISAEAKK